MNEERFKLEVLEEALTFLNSIPFEAKRKIGYNIRKVQSGDANPELFNKMPGTKEIWEFRSLVDNVKYRLFAFWDKEENALVVATSGIIKKSQRTPKREIEKAERIRQQYFKNKIKRDENNR